MFHITSKETEANRCPNAVHAAAHNETYFACAQSKEMVDIFAVPRALKLSELSSIRLQTK
jgi:hypothetical protein